jgi:carbon monoxide dehydrogenase subunit G
LAKVRQSIRVKAPIEAAFDYVADFTTAAGWDPAIVDASRLDVGPSHRDSRFRVVTEFNGQRIELEYTITEFDRPRRVVLVGDSPTFHRIDEVRFESAGDGTMVTYAADLQLKGVLRPATPLRKGRLEELGRNAISGLRRQLDRSA